MTAGARFPRGHQMLEMPGVRSITVRRAGKHPPQQACGVEHGGSRLFTRNLRGVRSPDEQPSEWVVHDL